ATDKSLWALLQLDGGARLLQLLSELLRLLFFDSLLDRLGRLVHERLGLFETQPRGRAHDLDDLDLLVSRSGQDHVHGAWFFGLLAARLSPAGGGSRHGRGDRGGRDPELLLERFDALGELEHGDALELLDPILSTGCHAALVLLGGTVLGGRR